MILILSYKDLVDISFNKKLTTVPPPTIPSGRDGAVEAGPPLGELLFYPNFDA